MTSVAAWLPPPDPTLSPYTGYTRQHWEAAAVALLTPVPRYASPARAAVRFPDEGRPGSAGALYDGLEGFARTFVAAAALLRHRAQPVVDLPRHGPFDVAAHYAAGLLAGTDPRHAEAWPRLRRRSQAHVEAAAIGIALCLSRHILWDGLDAGERRQVLAWLEESAGVAYQDSNWVLFGALIWTSIAALGGRRRPEEVAVPLRRIDAWYRGDGWYTDGPNANFDLYTPWLFHLYPALAAMLDPGGPADRAVDRVRLRAFLETWPAFVAPGAAHPPFGRSVTYRFAAAAPFAAGRWRDASPHLPGLDRRAASAILAYFVAAGCLDGPLRRGWTRPFLRLAEAYSGPASPAWASHGLLALLLPPDDPFWTDVERPLPHEDEATTVAVPGAGFLLGSSPLGVTLVNSASGGDATGTRAGYDRLTYYSRFAPDLPGADDPHPVRDGDAVLFDTRTARLVVPLRRAMAVQRAAVTRTASATHTGMRLETTVTFHGAVQVRRHRIHAPGAVLHDAGPAVPAAQHDALSVWRDGAILVVEGPASFCAIAAPGAELQVVRREGANPLGDVSATPYAVHDAPVVQTVLLAGPGRPRSLDSVRRVVETAI